MMLLYAPLKVSCSLAVVFDFDISGLRINAPATCNTSRILAVSCSMKLSGEIACASSCLLDFVKNSLASSHAAFENNFSHGTAFPLLL